MLLKLDDSGRWIGRSTTAYVRRSSEACALPARQLAVELGCSRNVVVENPHYRPARVSFQVVGAGVRGVPVDDDGLRVVDLPHNDTRLVYVTPSHQFPTGAVLPLTRRLELLAWAVRRDAYVLEDDYNGEFRYAGRPVETLQGLDERGAIGGDVGFRRSTRACLGERAENDKDTQVEDTVGWVVGVTADGRAEQAVHSPSHIETQMPQVLGRHIRSRLSVSERFSRLVLWMRMRDVPVE